MVIEFAPTAIVFLLAAWVVWFFWRLVRRMLLAFRKPQANQEPSLEEHDRGYRGHERREPTLEPAAAPAPAIASASEILALKASIDALTLQIADLARRLPPGTEIRQPANGAAPSGANKEDIVLSRSPLAAPGPFQLGQSLALMEKTS